MLLRGAASAGLALRVAARRTTTLTTTTTTTTTTAAAPAGWRRLAVPRRGCSSSSSSSSSSSGGGAQKQSLWQTYNSLLETHPLVTKAVTSGLIAMAGDCACQGIFIAGGTQESFSWTRLIKFSGVGLIVVGPVLHVWYGALMRFFPGAGVGAVVKRVAADQLLFAPVFLSFFLSTMLLLDGKAEQIPEKLKKDAPRTVVYNWSLWVPSQVVNFAFMPAQFQVLFANMVGVVWNVYLSFQSFKKVGDDDDDEAEKKNEA